jgi:phage shock protein E
MILLDVRTKEEYDIDHIEGALNFDIVNMLHGSFPNIDKDEEISIYCESGNRSMMAKNFMEKEGFTKITDVRGIDNLR